VIVAERSWVAIYVQAQSEQRVATQLKERGYEVFFPSYLANGAVHKHKSPRQLPLFPGYLFLRWSSTNPHLVIKVPRVIGFVGVRHRPLPVDDAEVEGIRRICVSTLTPQPLPSVALGNRVRIISGPLKHLEGIVQDTTRGYRFIINVTMLNRAVAVMVSADQVEPCQVQAYKQPDTDAVWPLTA